MSTESEKHWNQVKFYAQKWREAEKKEKEIRLKIIGLEVEAEEFKKEAKKYMLQCRGAILLEVI